MLVLLHLFVPIKKLSDEISDIKDGFGKEQLDVDDYAETAITVSYTHLDVYKRQIWRSLQILLM